MSVDSNGFDREYYLAQYGDIRSAGLDPYQHYLEYGWKEGRNPNPLFDTRFYLSHNGDVAAAKVNPLQHCMMNGARESRDPSAAFDTSIYLNINKDVAAAKINPLVHYLNYGASEKRALDYSTTLSLSEGFDYAYYLKTNPDVAAAGVDAYVHYQSWGKFEGRQPNALFDKSWYLAHNPDVAAAGLDALQHYLDYGWREGRSTSAIFDLAEYRSATGTSADVDPLVQYLIQDRYRGLPRDMNTGYSNIPQIIQARGQSLDVVLVGPANFVIGDSLTRVNAPATLLDGHDLSGFADYALWRSIGDVSITGSGRLGSLYFGLGDDSISGTFTLSGQLPNIVANAGFFTVNATFNDGSMGLQGGFAGSNITISGNASILFTGFGAADHVILGDGADSLQGGSGINYLDGGAGSDTAYWNAAVIADLSAGSAVSKQSGLFTDSLVNIENMSGSRFDDILLGSNGNNTLRAGSALEISGHDVLVGRGGDDALWGDNGNDVIIGGAGADTLSGGNGNDFLIDGADGWGANNRNPTAYGNAGDDVLVYMLGETGEVGRGNFASGQDGADTYIVDPSRGSWGNLGVEFSQIDGDVLDLSLLRTSNGSRLTVADIKSAASTPFYGSTVINLAFFEDSSGRDLSGRIVLNGVFAPSDLNSEDFLFSRTDSWQSLLPSSVLPDYLL